MENSTSSAPVVLKPGYASSFVNAARQFKVFWASLLLVAIAFTVITYLFMFSSLIFTRNYSSWVPGRSMFPENFWWFMLYIFTVSIIYGVLYYGYALATLKAAKGEKPFVADLFRPFTQFFAVIFSAILVGLIVGIGFILLIIPGIFFLCRLAFVPYLVVDQKVGVAKAINRSWDMTEGHFWKILFLGLTFIVIGLIIEAIYLTILIGTGNIYTSGNISGMWIYYLILSVIGIPVGIYIMLTWGSLYHAIRLEKDEVKPVTTGIVSS